MPGYAGKQGRKKLASTLARENVNRTGSQKQTTNQLLTAAPKPPVYLSNYAKIEWKRSARSLVDAKILNRMDLPAFEAYCDSYSKWREANDILKKTGLVIVNQAGFEVAHPAVVIARNAKDQMNKFGSEFGLNPMSRSRIPKLPEESRAAHVDPLPVQTTYARELLEIVA